jgi:molybdopterin converting factor small subunit
LEGRYLDEVLQGLRDRYPNLQSAVFDDCGDLKPHIRVFVNDRCIEMRSHQRSAVGEGDEVVLISAIAGG